MVDYAFYIEKYGGCDVPEREFHRFAREASAELARYSRIYTVTAPEGCPDAQGKAECAMIEVLFGMEQQMIAAQVQSVSIGSVSSSKAASAVLDFSPKAQAAQMYRAACRYLDISRYAGGA